VTSARLGASPLPQRLLSRSFGPGRWKFPVTLTVFQCFRHEDPIRDFNHRSSSWTVTSLFLTPQWEQFALPPFVHPLLFVVFSTGARKQQVRHIPTLRYGVPRLPPRFLLRGVPYKNENLELWIIRSSSLPSGRWESFRFFVPAPPFFLDLLQLT